MAEGSTSRESHRAMGQGLRSSGLVRGSQVRTIRGYVYFSASDIIPIHSSGMSLHPKKNAT